MARSKQGKTRIRDWKGLLGNESRHTKLGVAAVLMLVATSMTFMQLGFIGIGWAGNYDGYVLGLLGPIAVAALLLGRGWGTLMGLACGGVLFAHAHVQPLDLFERFIVTPLNSLVLYTVAGLVLGVLFSIALRNDPKGAKRVAYIALVCMIASGCTSELFTVNALLDAVLTAVMAQELGGELPHDTELAIVGMGSVGIQAVFDFVGMLALCLVADYVVARFMEGRTHASVLSIFRSQLLISAIIAFMVVQSGAFVTITMRQKEAAHKKMNDEIDFVGAQLVDREAYFTDVLSLPEFSSLSDGSAVKMLEGASIEQLIAGYDVKTDGAIVVFFDDTIAHSDSPAYPVGSTTTDVFGKENSSLVRDIAATGEMRSIMYSLNPPIGSHGSENTQDFYSDYQLGYICAKEVNGDIIMMAMPASMVFAERSSTVAWASVLAFALLLVIYVVAARLLHRVMVDPITRTNESLAKITAGKLDEPMTEVGSVEFALLSAGINTTVDSLETLIDEAERRNERDLATAKTIQESALPSTFPPFPEIDAFDIYASMDAAKEVGGDFYDFFLVDDHTLGFLIADVSGKGIPGALFMMAAKTELENYLSTGMSPAEAIASANRRLCANNEAGMFVTVWAATLDWNTGELTYVNAGHNYPLLRHGACGSWEWLKKKCGLFLGTFETAKYRQETITLVPGDELLLYTDGVNEAFNVDEVEYGNDRLEAFLAAHNDLHAQELVQTLRGDVATWAGEAEQSDDVTILALEFGVSSDAAGSVVVPATLEYLGTAERMVTEELERRLCPQGVQHKVEVALEELFVNVCSYAYAGQDEPGEVTVSYSYDVNPSTIAVELRDTGVPFNPVTREDPTKPSSIQEASIGGLGIFMVKKSVDELAYRREGNDNVVSFKKSW